MLKKIQQELRAHASQALISQASIGDVIRLKPLLGSEIFYETGRIIRMAEHDICVHFYKFDLHSEHAKEIFAALRELQWKTINKRQAITVNFLINQRGLLAQALYKGNKPTGLESLARELNHPFFNINVSYHITQTFCSLHAKFILVDKKTTIIFSGDPDSSCDTKMHRFENATLFSGNLSQAIHNEFMRSWQPSSAIKKENAILSEEKHATSSLFISKREHSSLFKPFSGESPFKISLLSIIKNAKKSIKIMTPNLNDPDICEALIKACERKVIVKIIMGKYHNHFTETCWGGNNLQTIVDLIHKLDNQVKPYLKVKWAANDKGKTVIHPDKHVFHGKFICIDDQIVLTGSSVLDKQSFYYSQEADLLFENKNYALLFTRKIFDEKFALGNEFHLDLYNIIVKKIHLHIKRLRTPPMFPGDIQPVFKQRQAGILLQNALRDITDTLEHPDIANCDKPLLLLNEIIPILKTDPNSTQLYFDTISLVEKYGVCYASALDIESFSV